MNYIYINNRDGKKYILNPQVTMGDKVCIIDMSSCEENFVSPKTLKRWYSKNATEDIVVELHAFTGMKIGLYRASTNSKGEVVIWTKNNKYLTFDPDMGNQTNARNPKFSNRIVCTYAYLKSTLDWVLS